MIYTLLTKKAIKIAYAAHSGQLDKEGLPYICHPLHVAESMTNEDATIVALLHDVIEDTDLSLDDLRREGFSDKVLDALALLTHDPSVPYFDYVVALSHNPLAVEVKLADLAHNSDPSRAINDERAQERKDRYIQAINFLTSLKK